MKMNKKDYNDINFPETLDKLKTLVNKYPKLLETEWEQLRLLSYIVSIDILHWQQEMKYIREREKYNLS